MLPSVIMNIYALGRAVQNVKGFNGPKLGVNYSVTIQDQEKRKTRKEKERLIVEESTSMYKEERKQRHDQLYKQKSETALKQEQEEDERMKKRRLQKGKSEYMGKKAKRKSISPVRYGMDLEAQERLLEKSNAPEQLKDEGAVMDWIETITGEEVDSIYDTLRSGVVLCKLINSIKPGTIQAIHTKPIPLLEMENIQTYLNACVALGVPTGDLFTVSDLYERKMLSSVNRNLCALARVAQNIPEYKKGKGKKTNFTGYHTKKRGRDDDLESGGSQVRRTGCCSWCTIL